MHIANAAVIWCQPARSIRMIAGSLLSVICFNFFCFLPLFPGKGLKGRTAVTKKMSAQVVGSMCSLIGDVKDILPYASTLLKYLKLVLSDANPEVRAVAARALAALYKGMVEQEVEVRIHMRLHHACE